MGRGQGFVDREMINLLASRRQNGKEGEWLRHKEKTQVDEGDGNRWRITCESATNLLSNLFSSHQRMSNG